MMRITLKDLLKKSVSENFDFDQLSKKYPAQIILSLNMLKWTH